MQRPIKFSIVCLIVVPLLLVACGETRPSQAEWRQEWIRAKSIVPDRDSVADDMSAIVCDDIVVALREEATDLLPTPTAQLDRQASLWLDMAEGAFFECPPSRGFDASYDDLDNLADSINALLEPPAAGS